MVAMVLSVSFVLLRAAFAYVQGNCLVALDRRTAADVQGKLKRLSIEYLFQRKGATEKADSEAAVRNYASTTGTGDFGGLALLPQAMLQPSIALVTILLQMPIMLPVVLVLSWVANKLQFVMTWLREQIFPLLSRDFNMAVDKTFVESVAARKTIRAARMQGAVQQECDRLVQATYFGNVIVNMGFKFHFVLQGLVVNTMFQALSLALIAYKRDELDVGSAVFIYMSVNALGGHLCNLNGSLGGAMGGAKKFEDLQVRASDEDAQCKERTNEETNEETKEDRYR